MESTRGLKRSVESLVGLVSSFIVAGETMSDLAKEIGVHEQTLKRWVTDDDPRVSVPQLLRLRKWGEGRTNNQLEISISMHGKTFMAGRVPIGAELDAGSLLALARKVLAMVDSDLSDPTPETLSAVAAALRADTGKSRP